MTRHPDFKITQKRKSNRFVVRKRGGGFVNGADKVKILVEAGKITAAAPKEPAPEKVAEPVEAAAEEAPATK